MDRILNRVLVEDPFLPEKHRAERPLYAALVPDEIFEGAHFERRFVTPFGNAWEKLAVVAGQAAGSNAALGQTVNGTVRQGRLSRIAEVLNKLEHGKDERGNRIRPDWQSELEYILDGSGQPIPTTVLCDVFIVAPNGDKLAFELKAPLPNSDQTKVSKEKMLKLYSMEESPIRAAYYALPYNPYGEKEAYSWAFPMRWFDMKRDPVVLIGAEFRDLIGGSGTYKEFISAVNEVGYDYRVRIYREFLGIEPPEAVSKTLL